MRLFGKKKTKSIVWGIRVPLHVRNRWITMSTLMRVPCNRLILFIMKDWAKRNASTLLNDRGRDRLANRIVRAYLNNELD